MTYYTGIGSRKTPENVFIGMFKLARWLSSQNYILRSGAADGADTAFEMGVDSINGQKEIWLPWKTFNGRNSDRYLPTEQHFELASTLHPAWSRLKQSVRSLHARNTGQVLGEDLTTPSKFVLCWTPDGAEHHSKVTKDTGGTGTAIRLASQKGIPVINLFNSDWKIRLKELTA